MKDTSLIHSPLGKNVNYKCEYDPTLLFSVPRDKQRATINIYDNLPFHGTDIWNSYEISWLNQKGKPQVAIGEFYVPCKSPFIFESKSFKLYLNSFYQTRFSSTAEVATVLKKDLSKCVGDDVHVQLITPSEYHQLKIGSHSGTCLDLLDIDITTYKVNPLLLKIKSNIVQEKLYSDLLKSNCLGTRQPDWASVYIHYQGPQIDHSSLLQYIISFREHNEFGEHCAERIFTDLLAHCKCHKLSVYARYTRRGGIDLNPFRSNFENNPDNVRDYRQ